MPDTKGRAFLVVMDSVGVGHAPDAGEFFNGDLPDTGAHTLGHIIEACAAGRADEGRSGPLSTPVLDSLGLRGTLEPDDTGKGQGAGLWGVAQEVSAGKDTPSGHWELAGLPVPFDWAYFPEKTNSFPMDILHEVQRLCGTDGTLGNQHASGTEVIARLGEQHEQSGWPICYTSADSVFQIAAHEETFGLERLLRLCEGLAPMLHERRIGRVIARPFTGKPGAYERTANRRDYALEPPQKTVLDWATEAGHPVITIGKVSDIFAGRNTGEVRKGTDAVLMDHLLDAAQSAPEGAFVFANFVEFDSLYGHRRDVAGYARHLEWFDTALAPVLDALRPDDLLILTADHGNDPTWPGTDHTRERVPVLAKGPYSGHLGVRAFADVGASVAAHLGLSERGAGESFL